MEHESRQRWLHELVERIDAVAWEADPETFQFRYVSPAAERLLGFPAEAWLEPGFWVERLHPDDRERAVTECVAATEAGRDHRLEYRLVAANGSNVWVEDDVEIVHADERPVALRGMLVDTTPRRREEANFRFLVDSSSDIVSVFGPDGLIEFHSSAIERVLGYCAGDVVGTSAFDYLHPDDRWRARQAFGVARLTSDYSDPVELRVRHRDGSWRWLEAVARGIDGGGLLVTSRDITVQRRTTEAQKMEALGRLATSIAHDFNNILLVVRGHAELLRDDVVDGKLDEVIRATERGAALTHQLLSFGRRHLTQVATCDAGATIRDLVAMLRPVFGGGIDLTATAEPGSSIVQMGCGSLEQIVLNLLLNARDALPDGGRIAVSVGEADGRVRIQVADTGTGMDERTRARIFEPFFTTKDEASGTGLGLASVFAIVAEHDGTITVDSAVGAGTTVEVELPSAR